MLVVVVERVREKRNAGVSGEYGMGMRSGGGCKGC